MKFDIITPGAIPASADPHVATMRDGVELACDVYLPDAPGTFPVVLVRLPYDKNGIYCFMDAIAEYVMRRGYAAVIQDVRGKFRSFGQTEFGVHEVEDGYDTIDWINEQLWCNGDVVMIGDSYYGLTQLCAAMSGHPALRAIAPRLTGTTLSGMVDYPGGTREVERTARRGYFATHYVERNSYDWSPDWRARPLAGTFEEFFAALGHRSPSYDREVATPDIESAPDIASLLASPPIPALMTVGWYDNCAVWSWPDVEALLADPSWRRHVWLRCEAVDHENNHVDDGTDGRPDRAVLDDLIERIVSPSLDFFDFHLGRGGPAPERVVFDVVNDGQHTASEWPPLSAQARVLYAVAGESVERVEGVLSAELPNAVTQRARWGSDGEDLVPSVAKDPFSLLNRPRRDLAEDATRADVCVFDSPPLPEPMTLAGPVTLSATISTDRVSSDLFARLIDIGPDGRGALIARGSIRMENANQEARRAVRLLHAGYRVQEGHRLRLQLASSDATEFVPNPGDGTSGWDAERILPAQVAVRTDREQPLTLRFSVLE